MSRNKDDYVVISKVSELRSSRTKSASKVTITPSRKLKADSKKKIALASMSLKVGNAFSSAGGGNVMHGSATNMYSPQLSTDFLEMPQSVSELRSFFRHFYNNDPFVGRAIDLHTELPLSKLRLTSPKGSDAKRNQEILKFFEGMVARTNLLGSLLDATREFYVIGEAFIFAEESTPEVPEEIYFDLENEIDADGNAVQKQVPRHNADELAAEYIRKHYQGWEKLVILPPDQVSIDSHQFVDIDEIELIPDSKTRDLVQRAAQGDPVAAEMILEMPAELREYLEVGANLPLGTDPYDGSFVYHLHRNKPSYQTHGVSILQRCLRTLIFRDKLRQANTSIASRAMTPKRLIYAEDLDQYDVEDLREQIDMALMDPDFSIITNYQVNWEEISAGDRLLNLRDEYDLTDRQLFAGLGVTEAMLTGDGSYSGERVNIEVINTQYMLYRERVQHYVEEFLFKPVAKKKGFVEYDEFGNEVLLYPRLSFTRLAVRDNRDTFDSMFNLYQKGSLSIDYILELLNLDPQAVRERIEKDMFTVNDSQFNEAVRSILGEVGRAIPTQSDFMEKFVEYIANVSNFNLSYKAPEEGGGRF